jgi:hypothetical protein
MRLAAWRCGGIAFFVFQLAICPLRVHAESGLESPSMPQATILSLSGTHYPAITRALSIVGFQVREASAQAYRSTECNRPGLLVIPEKEGSRLDDALANIILADLSHGVALLLDGSTPLTSRLGVDSLRTRGSISRYVWGQYADRPIRLPGRTEISRFRTSASNQVLAHAADHDSPIVISGIRGRGRFIYSAIPLEPKEGMVFEYLPFLAQAIVDQLRIGPTLIAENLCAYVDFGGEPRNDPAKVVSQLKRWSVSEVHLAAFYQSEMFLDYVPRFLAAAHAQGISVYAWLEYPMVSQEFWDLHPQWRELTADGRPAKLDWRLNMALEDPACFDAVAEVTRRLVRNYDWDGVDLAELYFEAEHDIFRRPADFTPMHPAFRRMFEQHYGVDPRSLFDRRSPNFGLRNPKLRQELADYRVELITRITQQLLEVLAACRKEKPYLQVTLTFIDALRDPTVTERYGVSTDRLLALQAQYGFGVEIEDPYTVWNSTPERYRAMGEYYRAQLQPNTSFSLDINVVDRGRGSRPLPRPRGLELYAILTNAASDADFVTLYGYATLSSDDMRLAPAVLAAQQGSVQDDGRVAAKRQIYWRTNTRGLSIYLDGALWPCYSDDQVLIPAGVHSVSVRPESAGAADGLNIEYISGVVVQASRVGNAVSLTYQSRGRCYVVVNREPFAILVDRAKNVAKVVAGNGSICIVLPQGTHQVDLEY